MRKLSWVLAVTAVSLLAACNNGTSPQAPAPGPTPPGAASVPLVSFVNTLFAATNETGSPVQINTLPLDTSDETPGIYAGLII